MANKLYCTVFKTKRGWIGILASKIGLRMVTLPQHTRPQAINSLGKQANQAILSPELFIELTEKFQHYYSREKTTFTDNLDFSEATLFQKVVWEATRLIPYGETRSYGWVANQIGKPQAARAVGQALGKNPFLIIIPCHRVISGDGGLGGFGGGLEMKQVLLELEKAITGKKLQIYSKASKK
jgi:methylated-DNA-[protein]-cysteine S-methyltransferase